MNKVHAPFADNISRLFGLHALTGREAAEILDTSPVAISEWRQGKRSPSLGALLRLSELFEIAGDRLVTSRFEDLLPELSDRERYRRVEAKIAQSRRAPTVTVLGHIPREALKAPVIRAKARKAKR